ncbi:MAG TPA: hypothetical protein PKA42_01975 [Candidatus Paceibacterota bacterium]|nr:hypothetical protein [Candidatus Paceibacterota bacterium]HMO82912.1 hypothetical protein [Candidatus Paceibacterota bacterium]
MKALRLALTINYSYLNKLKARLIYCHRALQGVTTDYHKQYGAYAGYWDEWVRQVEEIKIDLLEQVSVTSILLEGLQDFSLDLEQRKKLSKADLGYLKEVTELATNKINEQKALLENVDSRLSFHKQLTNKLLLVEAIEDLSDDG